MKKEIQFESNANNTATVETQQQPRGQMGLMWSDYSLQQGYGKLVIKNRAGTHPLRLLPKIAGATTDYFIHRFSVLKTPMWTAATKPGDLFDRAFQWFRTNKPQALFSFADPAKGKVGNPGGFKLKPGSQAIAWAIYWDENGKPHIGLLKSGFSPKSQNPGILADIHVANSAVEVDPITGNSEPLYPKGITHTEEGRLVQLECIHDSAQKDKMLAWTKKVSIGNKLAPLGNTTSGLFSQIPDEEMEMLVPLDQVVVELPEQKQYELLCQYLGAEMEQTGIKPSQA